jgi:hypothetical protein
MIAQGTTTSFVHRFASGRCDCSSAFLRRQRRNKSPPQHCLISIASKITAQFPPGLLSLLPAQDSFSTDPCPGDTLSGTNSHHGLIGPPTVRIALIRRRQITRSIRERKCDPLQRVILLSASRPGSDRAWRIFRRGREVNTAGSASTSRAFADTWALAGLESVESVDGGAEGGD